jgi:hypothetical protein
MDQPIEWVMCEGCGSVHPVEPSMAPGVGRETRCQRCLIAEIGRLERRLQQQSGEGRKPFKKPR